MIGSSARAAVIREAVLYTPLFVASVIVALLGFAGVWDLGILPYIMLVLALLFGYLSTQALRDLRHSPVTTRGVVTRIWSKRDVLVSKSYYISVERTIFKVPLPVYYDLREEAKRLRDAELDDEYRIEVAVTHYPHTSIVESVERLGQVQIKQNEALR